MEGFLNGFLMMIDKKKTDCSLDWFTILGVPICATNMQKTVKVLSHWAAEQSYKKVFVRDVSALMITQKNQHYYQAHFDADIVTPDGMPLVWLGKLRGKNIDRVCGPDLLPAVCANSIASGQSHYFYGGTSNVADTLAEKLSAQFPGLKVAGVYSPPFRDIDHTFELTPEVCRELDEIRASGADYVWVGLSSPKQDFFISKAAQYVGRGVFLAVGAAFDFHAGKIKRAPKWMQKIGLEGVYRLIQEPRRLWRRYLVLVPKFILLLIWEGLRRNDVRE